MLLPFQGARNAPVSNPGCRSACPGLWACWAFSPPPCGDAPALWHSCAQPACTGLRQADNKPHYAYATPRLFQRCALKGQKHNDKGAIPPVYVRFCPFRAHAMLPSPTQGAAPLALGYGLAGLSARPRAEMRRHFGTVAHNRHARGLGKRTTSRIMHMPRPRRFQRCALKTDNKPHYAHAPPRQFQRCTLKGQKKIAQGKRSDTLG